MHRRRGGKIFSLSRYIQVRTTATATKQAVSAQTLRQRTHLLHTIGTLFLAGQYTAECMGYSQQQADSPTVTAHNAYVGWSRKMGPSLLKVGQTRIREAIGQSREQDKTHFA
jgi:hypothetical protein